MGISNDANNNADMTWSGNHQHECTGSALHHTMRIFDNNLEASTDHDHPCKNGRKCGIGLVTGGAGCECRPTCNENLGEHYIDGTCRAHTYVQTDTSHCTCANGTAKTSNCYTGADSCASCDSNYVLRRVHTTSSSGWECVPQANLQPYDVAGDDGLVASTRCEEPKHYYNGETCVECGPGSFTQGGYDDTTRTQCNDCNPGHSCDGGSTQTLCPFNTYSLTGEGVCTPCDADGYAAAGSDSCDTCPAGSYVDGAECLACPAGHACDGATKEACTPGNYASGGFNEECSPCPEGTYAPWSSQDECYTCEAGHVVSDDRSECNAHAGECEHGYLISVSERTNDDHCGSCMPGYYLSDVQTCLPWGGTCENGTAPDQELRVQANECASCNDGYSLTDDLVCDAHDAGCENGVDLAQELRTADNQCGSCDAGFYLLNAACIECPAGSACSDSVKVVCDGSEYSEPGSEQCSTCEAGNYVNSQNTECSSSASVRSSPRMYRHDSS
jgi:hypothetical protein